MPTGRRRNFKTVFTAATYDYIEQFELGLDGDNIKAIQDSKKNKKTGKISKFREVIPTLEGLGLYLNRSVAQIKNYCKENENFKEAVTMVELLQARKLITCGLNNELNQGIVKLILVKHGYINKEEVVNLPDSPELAGKIKKELDKILEANSVTK